MQTALLMSYKESVESQRNINLQKRIHQALEEAEGKKVGLLFDVYYVLGYFTPSYPSADTA